MSDTTVEERLESALDRIGAAVASIRAERHRAERRFALLETASSATVAALDELIAGEPATHPAGETA
ncbi:MAG: hypothetical protein ACRYG4_20910 [Janthinobacterium lividum]